MAGEAGRLSLTLADADPHRGLTANPGWLRRPLIYTKVMSSASVRLTLAW
jgi:hypothetical protein